MWCTRWYLPLLLLPFPTAPPFFLLVLVFSLTLHARPCLYCIVLLVALFTSSCYWAPTPLDIPSHALEIILPTLNSTPISLQSLLDAPRDAPEPTATSRITYTARLERPKRCWCAPHKLFEPFNTTRWESRSTLSVFARRDYWEWLEEEGTPSKPEEPAVEPASDANDNVTESEPETQTINDTPTHVPSWQSRWATFHERVASLGRPKSSSSSPSPSSTSLESPSATIAKPPAPSAVRTPDIDAATLVVTATPTPETNAPLPWLRKQYDLRPYGGGVVLDFGWGRG